MGRAISLFSTAWDAYMEQPWTIITARVITDLVGLVFAAAGASAFLFRALTGTTLLPWVLDIGLAVGGVLLAAAAATILRTGLIAVLHDVLEGEETGWRRMVAVARDRFWTILGAYLGMTAIMAVVTVLLLAPALAVFALGLPPLLGVLLGVLGGVAALGVSLLFVFVDQAIVIHGVDAREALEESVGFARARYGLVLKLFGLMMGLSLAVSLLPYVGVALSSLAVVPVARLAYTKVYLDEGPVATEAV